MKLEAIFQGDMTDGLIRSVCLSSMYFATFQMFFFLLLSSAFEFC
ncbi:hypothetical protein AKJ16_DCAP08938 [Drosera capensis]